MPPFLLTIRDIPRYIALRRLMLETDPHAFAGHPESDGGLDPATVEQRITSGSSDILVTAANPADPASALAASAGVFREDTPKLRHRAFIVGVFVHPDARGQGLGRAVVSAAMDHAAAWPGVDSLCLSVSEHAPAAQRLYASLGFVAWGREPAALDANGTRYDEIHMQLDLSNRGPAAPSQS